MTEIISYLIRSSIASTTFYLTYLLFFKKQKHFDFNRIYLTVSMLMSFVIPLLTLSVVNNVKLSDHQSFGQSITFLPETTPENILAVSDFKGYHYLPGLYVLGVVIFSIHLYFSHLKAKHIIRKSRIVQLFNQPVNITSIDIHPFSFFNTIVLPEKILTSPDLEMIVCHEKIHVQEKHMIDILLNEILFLFQWFNPFAWLIKDAVKLNLEYKTDHELTKTFNPQKYQMAMVSLAYKKEVSSFLTALNGSQLKNRIIMMKKKSESKFAIVKQLFIVPLVALLVIGLSNKEARTESIQEKEGTNATLQSEEAISTTLELRKAIAYRIKFPWDATDLNKEISLSFYVNIGNNGKITDINEQVAESTQFETIDEVVVVAYRTQCDSQKSDNEYKNLLGKEAIRVLKDLPQIDMPDLKGKVVKFQFKFQTQSK